jgi:hypothetical protein
MNNIRQLRNKNVVVTFHEKTEYNKAYIIARDLTDRYNEPTIYTRKVRGIEKAWEFLEIIFNKYELQEDLNINDIYKVLDENFKLNVHSYCAID